MITYTSRSDGALLQYLHENLESLNVKLDPEEVRQVREIAKRADSTLGDRYPTAMLETLYTNSPSL
jgi:hypothetical protein